MRRRFQTVDVFTSARFAGNQLAVVLDAEGLDTARMQAIAREFNYAETTFVLPPEDAAHRARVRIFTPESEMPFAGHPNIGTAFVLAAMDDAAGGAPDTLVFEELAGLVPVSILREGRDVIGAELTAPLALSRGSIVTPARAAECLGLSAGDIDAAHAPMVASVGVAFLMVRVASLGALHRASADRAAYETLLPLDGAVGVYAYAWTGAETLEARMFAPTEGIPEDPATGSAAAAIVALLAELEGHAALAVTISQGARIGRPSMLHARAAGGNAFVAGNCAAVMDGWLEA